MAYKKISSLKVYVSNVAGETVPPAMVEKDFVYINVAGPEYCVYIGKFDPATKGNTSELILKYTPGIDSSLTESIIEALLSASDPSGGNPMATIDDIPIIPFLEYNSFLTQGLVSTTSGLLVVGKTYNIEEVLLTDDFANVGYVEAGVDFVATGTTPTVWSNSTVVINQTDSAPQDSVLWDTITGITYRRISAGRFNVISAGKFTANKTAPYSAIGFDKLGNKFTAEWIDINTIELYTYLVDDLETPADGVLNNQEFNIKVRKP